MDNRRDSSVWQSLAITFGGGLALGAVGMKLTQEARRAAVPSGETAARQGPADQPVTLDPRLLDAIVAAVDARLHDHTAGTERRIQEVRDQFREEIAGIRTAVGEELNEFGAAISKLVAEQVATLVDARAAAVEQALEPRMIAAAEAAFEREIAPLRARVQEKERELAELRQRLMESERTVLDVILAIGAACQQAAERVGAPAAAEPAAAIPMAAPPPPDPPGGDPGPPLEAGGAARPTPKSPTAEAKPGRLWRIPMVSSFVAMTMGLLLIHYL